MTPAECRLIHLLRMAGFGQVLVTLRQGEPVQVDILNLSVALDKPQWPGQLDIIRDAK